MRPSKLSPAGTGTSVAISLAASGALAGPGLRWSLMPPTTANGNTMFAGDKAD